MKQELSSLELFYLVKELKILEGSKVDRVYHSKESKDELVISLHISGEGKRFLNIDLPGKIFIKEIKTEQGTPTGLCMMLRKYLEGSILNSISQVRLERVIELRFDARSQQFFLIIELFSKGNIIFCDMDHKILNILEEQHWKDRELKNGSIYNAPVSKYDASSIGKPEFFELIRNSEKDSIVKSLAIELGLGGTYAEEVCYGIDKSQKPKDVNDKTIESLYKRLKGLFLRKPQANKIDIGAFPFVLESLGQGQTFFVSFNEAIINSDSRIDKARLEKEKQLAGLKHIIEEQNKNLADCKTGYKSNQDKAEFIYAHYKEIDELLKAIRDIRKAHSWLEIRDKVSKDKKFGKLIKQINEKDNEITIDID